MHARRTALLAVLLLAASGAALAQQRVDAAGSIRRAEDATARLGAEVECLRARRDELERTVRLMHEARAQAASGAGGARAQEDANQAIGALERRAAEIEQQSRRCFNTESSFPRELTAPAQVVVVPPPPDPVADRVATQNAPTAVIEQGTQLSESVHVIEAERVDGEGRLDGRLVRDAVHQQAGAFEACYGNLVRRGALARGELHLVFTIDGTGRVADVVTEASSISNDTFRRCVRDAGRGLRAGASPAGGAVTYSWHLRFGPE